jgi:hypothetical protein
MHAVRVCYCVRPDGAHGPSRCISQQHANRKEVHLSALLVCGAVWWCWKPLGFQRLEVGRYTCVILLFGCRGPVENGRKKASVPVCK